MEPGCSTTSRPRWRNGTPPRNACAASPPTPATNCAPRWPPSQAAGPDHQWLLDLPETPVLTTGDRDRLHQALANLLSDARLHTPPGTTVRLRVVQLPTGVTDTVTDDGPGIPEKLQDRLFERFTRGGEGRSRSDGGSGLGLAVAHAVAAAHNGTLAVRSRPGRTEFRLDLP
ncbi:sensor histidine kinase [Streptacidiphilus sp. PAMC 29251]